VWAGRSVILDGHTGHSICTRHGLPFHTQEVELPDREAARLWILRNALGRRNMHPDALAYVRGRLYAARKHQGARSDLTSAQCGQKSSTAEQLAEESGVAPQTVRRDAEFARDLDVLAQACGDEIRQAVLSARVKLSRKDIRMLVGLNEAEQRKAVKEVLRTGRLPREAEDFAQSHPHPTISAPPEDESALPVEQSDPEQPQPSAGSQTNRSQWSQLMTYGFSLSKLGNALRRHSRTRVAERKPAQVLALVARLRALACEIEAAVAAQGVEG
jgi:hypothetical protein